MIKIGDAQLHQGEALGILATMEDNSVDAILTDPPYSSGGMTLGQKHRPPSEKYQSTSAKKFPEFSGDNRDQRSFMSWATLWLAECHRIAKPGSVCMMFTDWRQLPTMSDALQAGGWLWRRIVIWDKPTARPSMGEFRNQCEFVLVGTKGQFAPVHKRCLPGIFRQSIVSGPSRKHMTEKPVPLLRNLMEITPEGGTILDPFMGSASTGQACLETARKFVGIEMTEAYFDIACDRLSEITSWGCTSPRQP
ncbi:MAG: site-specific DNA-methyltransferase [Proteobacteria bacterium]|nr:site-specific DNA-methyltransferase [Pseudomonadota bacterium]